MSIQNISGVENMLAQMRALSRAAASPSLQTDHGVREPGGFAAELARSLQRVAQAQNGAAAQARAFEMGVSDISLNDVMIDMQKANIAFQATVQVRNRLVAAYQEIASMPI